MDKSTDKILMRKWQQTLDTRGFTLVEVIVAMVILSVTVGGVMSLMTSMQRGTFQATIRSKNTCIVEAQKILGNIKEKGLARASYNYVLPTAGTPPYRPTAGDPAALEFGITHDKRWPVTKPIYDLSTTPDTLRPYMLTMGYMTALEAIYTDTGPSICNGNGNLGINAYNDNTLLTPIPTTSELGRTGTDGTAYLRVQLYDLDTYGPLGCSTAANIRPRRATDTNNTTTSANAITSALNLTTPSPPLVAGVNYPAAGTLAIARPPANTNPRGDLGFLVSITVTYTDRSGRDRRCSLQERFQYDMQPRNNAVLEVQDAEATIDDTDTPEDLNTTIVTSGLNSPPDYGNSVSGGTSHYRSCDQPTTTNFNLRLARTRPGSIHMCRDLSRLRPANVPANRLTLTNGRRTTFYSDELMRHPFYGKETIPSRVLTGMYYPGSVNPTVPAHSQYFCNSATFNCTGLPRFESLSSNGAYFPPTATNDYFYFPSNLNAYFPYPANNQTRPGSLNAYSRNAALTWQPCERTTICGGVTPTAATFVPGTFSTSGAATRAHGYHLQYQNLPVGCEIHIQVAEIDAAYNVSTADVREYVQENVPGNKLCWNGISANRYTTTFPAESWFFSCTDNGGSAPAAACDGAPAGMPCCVDFPFYNNYKPHLDY